MNWRPLHQPSPTPNGGSFSKNNCRSRSVASGAATPVVDLRGEYHQDFHGIT